jgi:hypothetical protein
MSTPEKNIEILRYFGKWGILTRIRPAKIAGLYGSLFFQRSLARWNERRGDFRLSPEMAIKWIVRRVIVAGIFSR